MERKMEKITSFMINHLKLLPGIYVSRIDEIGEEIITTFDLRITRPNFEPVINTAELHTIEHLGATFLRNHEKYADKTIYFGPMGCRTGFYMIIKGKYQSEDILPLVTEMFEFISGYDGNIPGASAKDCGNYLDMNLGMAKYWAYRYLQILSNITIQNLRYPD
jgi:S-ribosylhomocysteine lyase